MTFDLRRKLKPIGKLELLRDIQQCVDAYYERLGVLEDNPDVMRRRAVNLFNSGDLQSALRDLAAAERLYTEGAQILERLADSDPSNAGWQRDLVASLWRLSGQELAEPEAARGYLVRALEILEALDAAGRLHGEHRNWLVLVRQRLRALDILGN